MGSPAKSVRDAEYRAKNPRVEKSRKLKWMYGITLDERDAMLDEQLNRCAICKRDDPGPGRGDWYVDHNHHTGKVRGILCHHCNCLLGYAKEDSLVLFEAAKYLQNTD